MPEVMSEALKLLLMSVWKLLMLGHAQPSVDARPCLGPPPPVGLADFPRRHKHLGDVVEPLRLRQSRQDLPLPLEKVLALQLLLQL